MAPLYNGVELSPDDDAKKGLCPECAADLTGKNIQAHAEDHWPQGTIENAESAEARRRKALLIALKH
jgi:hypothetical protein